MAGVIPTTFRDIAPLIVARLAAKTPVNAERQFWVARSDKLPNFAGKSDLILHPRRTVALQGNVEGGGRWDTRVVRILDVGIRVQHAVDSAMRDEQWLFADDGYIALEEAVVDALQLFDAKTGSGDLLLSEPMRLLTAEDPRRSPGNEAMWGDGLVSFEMVYILDLDTTGE